MLFFKRILFFLLFFFLFLPVVGLAQEQPSAIIEEDVFEARVIKILEEREIIKEDGSKLIQQNLQLKGLGGNWKNKEMVFKGISDLEVIAANRYKEGDRVMVNYFKDNAGEERFLVFDLVRRGNLYLLAFIFAVLVIIVGQKKGLRALLSLILSFIVILYFIVPRILNGGNPLGISLIGALALLVMMVYLTEGLNKKSHLAVAAIFCSVLIISFLSYLFTWLTRLTGLAQEETMYLMGVTKQAINFKGLLMAGFLIGAMGVLDDIIISQIEAVEQIQAANPSLTRAQVFKAAFAIGNTHLGAAINTLFLTYAGAALPLLMLFSIKQPPFMNFSQIINNEALATEIVRTLVGSIGIVLALPIATFLATIKIKPKI